MIRRCVKWARRVWAREPLVVSGVIAAVFTAVVEDAQDGRLSWSVTVPIALGLICRQFVTSPASRAELERALAVASAAARTARVWEGAALLEKAAEKLAAGPGPQQEGVQDGHPTPLHEPPAVDG